MPLADKPYADNPKDTQECGQITPIDGVKRMGCILPPRAVVCSGPPGLERCCETRLGFLFSCPELGHKKPDANIPFGTNENPKDLKSEGGGHRMEGLEVGETVQSEICLDSGTPRIEGKGYANDEAKQTGSGNLLQHDGGNTSTIQLHKHVRRLSTLT